MEENIYATTYIYLQMLMHVQWMRWWWCWLIAACWVEPWRWMLCSTNSSISLSLSPLLALLLTERARWWISIALARSLDATINKESADKNVSRTWIYDSLYAYWKIHNRKKMRMKCFWNRKEIVCRTIWDFLQSSHLRMSTDDDWPIPNINLCYRSEESSQRLMCASAITISNENKF
jgi:hypothetical protein